MQLTPLYCGCVLAGLITISQSSGQQFIKTEEHERSLDSHSRSKRELESDTLLFPDEHISVKQTLRRDVGTVQLNPSPCPDKAQFCDSADDYPRDRIQTLLKKKLSKTILNHFFTEEDASNVERFGEHDETSLCPSKPLTVYPKKAESKEGLLEFIVNEDNYKQGIKVETCGNEGNSCNIPGSLSLGYTSHCRQKNILRTLVVVNKNVSDAEGFITKPFEFPSCCACMIAMDQNRFGGAGTNQELHPTTPAVKSKATSTPSSQRG